MAEGDLIERQNQPINPSAEEALSRMQGAGIPRVGERPQYMVAQAGGRPQQGGVRQDNGPPAEAADDLSKTSKPAGTNPPGEKPTAPGARKEAAPIIPDKFFKGAETAVLGFTSNGLTSVLHPKHDFKLNFGRDEKGQINKITTSFGDKRKNEAERVYEKNKDGAWFYKPKQGEPIRMQGDLKVDEKTGHFTQVLRRDVDDSGSLKETTRTMNVDGTDTINRMDGTASAFKYDKDGKMTEWTETDSTGKPKSFKPFQDPAHKDVIAFKSEDGEKRYAPKVEDNGNVNYKTTEDLGKEVNQIVTSSGDHIVNGGNGVKYEFDHRGDVTAIQFPKPRLFEGHLVSRIAINYRDTYGNQGQIIDKLTLYGADGLPVGLFQRDKQQNDNPAWARDKWNVFDGTGKFKYQSDGDFAIKDGLISTTEPLPTKQDGSIDDDTLKQLTEHAPLYKKMIDEYKAAHDGKLPPAVLLTYLNSKETANINPNGISIPNDSEYQVKPFEGNKFNYPVPGELPDNIPVSPPPPVPKPPPPPPSNGGSSSGKPARPSRALQIGGSRIT